MVRTINSDQGAGQFDRTVYFTSGLSTDQVVDTYRSLFPKLGWDVIYDGSGAQRSAGDRGAGQTGQRRRLLLGGGVVVSPTTSAGTTPFSIEVYELPDDN